MWMHQLNLPTLHYRGIHSFFPPHHISYLYLTARFDVTRHIWHQFKSDILQLASRIQQSKQQFYLSISPINPAKLTAGPGRSLWVSFYPSVRPLNITVSFFSAASPGLTAAHSDPHHASLSEEKTGWSMTHSETSTQKLQSCGKQVLKA